MNVVACIGRCGMLWVLATLPAWAQLGPSVFRVGAFGAPCTHATLQAALADATNPFGTEIRLADNQVYNGININIIGKDLSIIGGYTDCSASRPTTGVRTVLSGSVGSGDSVIEIVGGATRREVLLRNLEIRGGEADADGGGGVEIDGNAIVTFDFLKIVDNVSGNGGGVHVSGVAQPVELRILGGTTYIGFYGDGNIADGHGGGLYCEHASIHGEANLALYSNQATSDGGGAFFDDCSFALVPPPQIGAVSTSLFYVNYNSASNGGGLWAQNGSQLVLHYATHSLSGNDAIDLDGAARGGGIGITGAATSLYAQRIRFAYNLADATAILIGSSAIGGGLYVGDHAQAVLDGGTSPACRDYVSNQFDGCVLFQNNSANAQQGAGPALPHAFGGGVYVGGGSSLVLRRAQFERNYVQVDDDSGYGSAGYANGTGTQFLLESAIVHHNYPDDAMAPEMAAWVFTGGVDATLAFATLADASNGPAIQVSGAGTVLALHASALFANPPDDVVFDDQATVQVSCLLGSPFTTVPTIGNLVSTDFVDAVAGDFRPRAHSALIDRCNNTPYAPTSLDMLGYARPLDDPGEPNSPGLFDVGAYERPDYIFVDGFQ